MGSVFFPPMKALTRYEETIFRIPSLHSGTLTLPVIHRSVSFPSSLLPTMSSLVSMIGASRRRDQQWQVAVPLLYECSVGMDLGPPLSYSEDFFPQIPFLGPRAA